MLLSPFVQMYCTGGIRCDVYSSFLRRRGFTNLYSLEGGVQTYLRDQVIHALVRVLARTLKSSEQIWARLICASWGAGRAEL